MTTIEAYNYSVGFDTSRLESGGIITRRELSQLRRDFRSLQAPADKSNLMINRLTEGLNKGAVGVGDYVAAIAQIRATMPDAIQRQKELSDAQRAATSIRAGLITEDQRYAQEVKRVAQAVREGGLSMAEGRSHMKAFKATQETAVTSTRDLAAAQRQASVVIQGLKTEGELLAEEESVLIGLFERDLLTEQQLSAARKQLADRTTEAVEAAKQLADAERQVQEIRQRRKSEKELINDKAGELQSLVGKDGFTQKEATQELKDFVATMPAAIAARDEISKAERDAVAIRQKQMTEDQRYRDELKRVSNAVKRGGLDRKTATAHLKSYKATLPSAVAATRKLATAEREHADLMQRGTQVTDRYTSAAVKHARAIELERKELKRLKDVGAIDSKTFGRATRDVNRRSLRRGNPRQGLLASAQQLPAVGGMAGGAGRLASMGPQMAAAAVAIGGVVVAYRTMHAAASQFTADMIEQGAQITDLSRRSRQLGTDIKDLIGFQTAMRMEAGISADQSANMLTKLSVKIGEAGAGGGDAKATLDRLGLDARQLASMDPAMAFREVVKAAHALPNPIDRATAAAKLFEEEGIIAGRVFDKGTLALDQGAIAAERMGLAVSQADAAAIEDLTREVDSMKMMYEGFVRQTLAELAPTLIVITRDAKIMLGVFKTGIESIPLDSFMTGIRTVSSLVGGLPGLFVGDQIAGYFEGAADRSKGITAEFEKQAAIKKREADAVKMSAHIAKQRTDVEAEMTKLRETMAPEKTARELMMIDYKRLLHMGATIDELQAMKRLHKEIAEHKRASKVDTSIVSTEKELELLRMTMQIRKNMSADSSVNDTATAKAQAELMLAGATAGELNRHLKARRELVALQARDNAMKEQQKAFETLKADAATLKKSMVTPAESLASDFQKINQMYRAGLLTAQEYAKAKVNAARELVDIPADMGSQSLGIAQAYDAMVEDQKERRRIKMERDETRRLIVAANQVAAHEAKRLQINERITKQMAEQARIAGNVVGGPVVPQSPGQSQTSPGQDDRTLDRIAEASEATASAIGQWQMGAI